MIDSAYFVKSTFFRNQLFSEILLNPAIVCIYVTDLLSMCMKKFDTEKVFFFFFCNTTRFSTEPFSEGRSLCDHLL